MKNKKAKGSVLYTVVSVMMIMTVFIFAALALASASNKRAFNTYANNQTQYTARSVVDSICKALETNENFSSSFSSLNKGDTKNVTVDLPEAEMGSAVKATVTNIGVGADFGINSPKPVYKISANVKMLGRENTFALYVLADYAKTTSPFKYSLVSLKDAEFSNHFSTLGGSNFGIHEGISTPLQLNNDIVLNGFTGINGSAILNTSSIKISNPGEGFYINGDLLMVNNGQKISSEVSNIVPYKQIPYVYVEGNMDYGASTGIDIGDQNHPVNVYAGSIANFSEGDRFFGDVYLLDEHKYESGIEKGLSNFVLSGDASGLYSWTGNLVNKRNGNGSNYVGGNLYSKGKILLSAMGNGDYIFGNDIISDEFQIDANNFNATSITLNGATVVKNDFTILSFCQNLRCNFNKGLFVDYDKANIAQNVTINGVNSTGKGIQHISNAVSSKYEFAPESPAIYSVEWSSLQISPMTTDPAFPVDSTYFFENGRRIRQVDIEWESDTAFDNTNVGVYLQINSGWVSGALDEVSASPTLNGTSGIITVSSSNDLFCAATDEHLMMMMNGTNIPIKIKSVTCSDFDSTVSYDPSYIKDINQPVFANNGGTIYIDNIDQSIKIETLDSAGELMGDPSQGNVTGDPSQFAYIRVSSVLMSEDESLNLANNGLSPAYVVDKTYNYSTEYGQFLKDIVSIYSNMYPSAMTKDNLKSNKIVDNSFIQPEMAQGMIANGKTSTDIYSTVNFNNKPVYYQNGIGGDLYRNYIGDDGNRYCEKRPFSALVDGSSPISESCTIIGALQANSVKDIYIDPGNKEIWIRLVDFYANNVNIIVNDEGGGKVNFFVPKEGEVINDIYTLGDNYFVPVLINGTEDLTWAEVPFSPSDGSCTLEHSRIVSKYYNDAGGSYDLLQNPDTANDAEKKMIPNINFYMDAETHNGWLNLSNDDTLITGYIMAPTATFNKSGGGGSLNVRYDHVDCASYSPQIIGAAVFETVYSSNQSGFIYINPGSASADDSSWGGLGKFTTLYYQCS